MYSLRKLSTPKTKENFYIKYTNQKSRCLQYWQEKHIWPAKEWKPDKVKHCIRKEDKERTWRSLKERMKERQRKEREGGRKKADTN